MSARLDLQTAVEAAVQSAGIITVNKGDPRPDTPLNVPYAVLEFGDEQFERLTFGLDGLIAQYYDVEIWWVLGAHNMTPQEAEAARLNIADTMRALFANFTLSGFTTVDLATGNHNMKTYRQEGISPQATYRLRAMETKAASAATGTVLERAAAAVVSPGWRSLGSPAMRAAGITNMVGNGTLITVTHTFQNFQTDERLILTIPAGPYSSLSTQSQRITVLSTTSFTFASALTGAFTGTGLASFAPVFKESDILYNADDEMYYLFNTSADGNNLPGGVGIDPFISMRRATTIEALVAAVGANYVPRVSEGHWYANVWRSGSGASSVWHIFGTTAVSTVGHRTMTGLSPLWVASAPVDADSSGSLLTFASHSFSVGQPIKFTLDDGLSIFFAIVESITPTTVTIAAPAIPSPRFVPAGNVVSAVGRNVGTRIKTTVPIGSEAFCSPIRPLLLGDICVRRNPADGYWWAVGVYNNTDNDIRIYRNADITNECGWAGITAVSPTSVWADIGIPAWSANYTPDPNICFVDGKCFLTWTGGLVSGEWNMGIVEIDLATGKATGPVEILLEWGNYPDGRVWSDLTFLRVPGELDRILGFGGGNYDGSEGPATWGCLELGP